MDHRLEIDGWKTGIRFSACHMLLHHDKCSRIHGHSYSIHLKVHGTMNEENMLFDFGKVKKKLREFAEYLDHMVLVPTENPDISISRDEEKQSVIVDMGGKEYMFPIKDVRFLPIPTTTVEEMSKYLLIRLIDEIEIPANISRLELGMDEGVGQGAWASEELGQ